MNLLNDGITSTQALDFEGYEMSAKRLPLMPNGISELPDDMTIDLVAVERRCRWHRVRITPREAQACLWRLRNHPADDAADRLGMSVGAVKTWRTTHCNTATTAKDQAA